MDMKTPISKNEVDSVIGGYIAAHPDGNFNDVLLRDQRWEVLRHLSDIQCALFGWYQFRDNSSLLQIGGEFGALSGFLCERCKTVTVIENDPFRAKWIKSRWSKKTNIHVLTGCVDDACGTFDYILQIVDVNTMPVQKSLFSWDIYLSKLKKLLAPDGKLLLAVWNRFGIRSFCGTPSPVSGIPFDGIADENNKNFALSRQELLNSIKNSGFKFAKLYYPMPDHQYTQLIYTDEYLPNKSLYERLNPLNVQKDSLVMDETKLYSPFIENGVIPFFSNSFFIECGNKQCSNVIYAALSAERNHTESYATCILSDETVEKRPLYPDAIHGLKKLYKNTEELLERGVPVLPMRIDSGCARMKRVHSPTLADYIRQLGTNKNKEKLLSCLDKLYEYILQSSPLALPEENALLSYAPEEDWGPILKKAYIEMIPVNCFYDDGKFIFFDQEVCKENYPACYIMYRTVRDICAFVPETEKYIPLDEIRKRYGIIKLWTVLENEEIRFQDILRQRIMYHQLYSLGESNHEAIQRNRRALSMNNNQVSVPDSIHMFDAVGGLNEREIILFGAGRMAEHYLAKYGEKYPPSFIVDNAKDKWGTKKNEFEIKNPETLRDLKTGQFRVVICCNDYENIAAQLEQIGVVECNYRVYQKKVDDLLGSAILRPLTEGKYNVGYVTGVFDLFHIGHLNILRQSKKRCQYLIAGVLTDELTERDKNKKPFIPFNERIEIVQQIKCVDRVVPVDFHNTDKVDAWRELRYDSLFAGSDHEGEPCWMWLQKQLRSLGSNLEFFPYTQNTNSTELQKIIKKAIL